MKKKTVTGWFPKDWIKYLHFGTSYSEFPCIWKVPLFKDYKKVRVTIEEIK